jgi:hypothetical protein
MPRPWHAGVTAQSGLTASFKGALPASVADQCCVVTEEQVLFPLIWYVPALDGQPGSVVA